MVSCSSFDSVSSTSFLISGKDDSSCAPLLVSQGDASVTSGDLISFDCSIPAQSTPVVSQQFQASVSPARLSVTPLKELILHLNVFPPPKPSCLTPARNIETELRDVVDGLLRQKKDAHRTLAEENTSLRAQVAFLKQALAQASTQPGSEVPGVLDALERERTLRQNAEESSVATGKYLAEQVDTVLKQKVALERALRNFTHGCDFWKDKAIAVLERCETLEEENIRVKTQLNVLARKHSSVVTQQVDLVLREVAEERDRLKGLEDEDFLAAKQGRDGLGMIKSYELERTRRGASRFQIYRITTR